MINSIRKTRVPLRIGRGETLLGLLERLHRERTVLAVTCAEERAKGNGELRGGEREGEREEENKRGHGNEGEGLACRN